MNHDQRDNLALGKQSSGRSVEEHAEEEEKMENNPIP